MPFASDRRSEDAGRPRPVLRGHIHLAMAVVSVPALILLILLAGSPREYVSASIYGTAMVLLYSASAAHHIGWRSGLLSRLDRAMIYILIAGTYTPFCLLLLGNAWGIPLLAVIWSIAGIGAFSRFLPLSIPRWPNLVAYTGLGWLGLIAAVPLALAAPLGTFVLAVAGGFLYSAGGVVHAVKRPDPFPAIFGYHEVFHVLTVLAGGAFFVAVAGRIAA